MKVVLDKLKEKKLKISFMESCTGGGCANALTNISGASKVLEYSAVTYSNEYKIKMGVKKEIIDQFSVYSKEVAREMALKISLFSNSDLGVGVTGQLKKIDPKNIVDNDDLVYICIYDKRFDRYYDEQIRVCEDSRYLNKEIVINKVFEMIKNII